MRQVTPGTSFNSFTIKSRRARNSFFIAMVVSCGPPIASTAAHWLICDAHDSVLMIQRPKCGARIGFDAKPIRQPVIAHAFDAPSAMMVRSYMSGIDAMDV